MRLVPAVVVGLVVTMMAFPTSSVGPSAAPRSAPRAGPSYADAVPGPALPVRPRVPNRALFVGADDDFVLYHSGHVDPATERVDYMLVSLTDGHVVRTLQPVRDLNNIRLVDNAIVVVDRDVATRYDAVTGSVTGTVVGVDDYTAIDDQWVMTNTAVHWFDGRIVPLSQSLGFSPFSLRVLGDSDLAVLANAAGFDPVAITATSGVVTDLERSGEEVRVFAARGGDSPVLYGTSLRLDGGPDGIVRWSDPAHDAGRTVIDSNVLPFGGGLAGERVLVHLSMGDREWVAELDLETGEAGPALTEVFGGGLGLRDNYTYGDSMVQSDQGLVVSAGETPQGELALVTSASVRDLGAPRPSPLTASALYRSSSVVLADFYEIGGQRGSAAFVEGDSGWTTVPGPVTAPTLPADPASEPGSTCADPTTAPEVVDVRGRWQLEHCARYEDYVTDRSGVLPAWRVAGFDPQLGADHVVYTVLGPGFAEFAVAVTGLDARHDSRVYGPTRGTYSVDLVDSEDPVYADASGQVRLAPARGLADTTGPVISDVHAPPSAVASVRPVRLAFSARARDAVDGDDVVIRVQTRWAPRLRPLGPWQTQPSSASGRVTVSAQPGEEWCFRAVAADRSGNVTVDDPGTCSTVPLDDRVLRRVGPVGSSESKGYLGGDAARLAGPRGSLVVGAVRGTRPILYLRSGPRGGVLVVRQAGRVVQRVDTRARRPGLLVVLVQRPGVPLRWQARGQRPVLVDAIGHRRLS